MHILTEKPYLIFWGSIPILMLVGILYGDSVLYFNVHDTYFVIAYLHVALLIAVFFGILGIGYWMVHRTNRKLSKWLSMVHLVLTLGGLIALFGVPNLLDDRTAASPFPVFDQLERQNLMVMGITILLLVGQLLYLVNLTIGIFRKNKTSAQ